MTEGGLDGRGILEAVIGRLEKCRLDGRMRPDGRGATSECDYTGEGCKTGKGD